MDPLYARYLPSEDAQLLAFADGREAGDAADAVHVASDDVASKPILRTQCFFQVDRPRFDQAGGLVQRFG
jgi:hypothetical protein